MSPRPSLADWIPIAKGSRRWIRDSGLDRLWALHQRAIAARIARTYDGFYKSSGLELIRGQRTAGYGGRQD